MATVIRTATELQAMSADLDGDYELGCSFDASETAAWNAGAGFVPVGDNATPFTGTFDGKGFTITSLTINRPATDNIGLFGYTAGTTGAHVTIKSVTMASAAITGDDTVAALVGKAMAYTDLSDCHSSGTIAGDGVVGGLVGTAYDEDVTLVTFEHCDSSCTVTASGTDAGGLIGNYTATVTDCYATGAVTALNYASGFGNPVNGAVSKRCFATGNVIATNNYAGGFCGYLGGPIEDCYAKGTVTGDASADGTSTGIGGFAGETESAMTVKRCYSTGAVAGTTVVGGFIGADGGATYTGCCWDTTTSGTATACGSGAVTGVTGYTTDELQDTTVVQGEGFSIGRTWNVIGACNAGYPCLIGVNPCCSVRGIPADVTIAQTKPSLELIRNLEMQCDARFFIAKDGKAKYESRFARHA